MIFARYPTYKNQMQTLYPRYNDKSDLLCYNWYVLNKQNTKAKAPQVNDDFAAFLFITRKE